MKSKSLKVYFSVFTFIFLFVIAFSQNTTKKGTQLKPALLPDPQKIITVEGITEYQLQNGLRILLFPDKTKQTATVNITYLVGSRFENYGETGMAHLLEHMLFKGSTLHTNIPQELTSHGARPNGSTWFDRTNYFETFSSTDENLTWALDLESDRMVNSFVAQKDFDSEFSVVRNEMESGENDPSRILRERVYSTAYIWHNYGKSTIGARSDVENVSIKRLQDFYHLYYQPDNAVLTVSGNIDPDKTLKLINAKFGIIPRPSRVLPKLYTLEPVQDGERTVTLRRTGDVQIVASAYHIPSGPDSSLMAIEVLSGLLADNPSGRLYKKLIDTHKASKVTYDCDELHDPGMVYFEVTVPKDKSLEEAQKILEYQIESFVKEKPTDEEVERIKNKMLKDIDLTLNSSERIGLNLSEYIAQGDWRLLFYSRDLLKKVTADQVMNVAVHYFTQSNRTTGFFIPTENPQRSVIPQAPDIAAMLKDYKGSQNISEGEAFDANSENIQKRLNTFRVEGININMLSKKNRGEAVNAIMTFRFGNEKDLMGKGLIPMFTSLMMNKGTESKTRQQIQDQLDLLKARVDINGSATELNVRIETIHPNLAAVILLVKDMIRKPSFPADELEKLKLDRIAQYEKDKSEPNTIAVNEMMRHYDPYSKDDSRHVMTIDETIENIKKYI